MPRAQQPPAKTGDYAKDGTGLIAITKGPAAGYVTISYSPDDGEIDDFLPGFLTVPEGLFRAVVAKFQ